MRYCVTFIDLSERFFDLGHQIGGIHAVAGWNPRSSHPRLSNLRKADPGGYFGVSIWPPRIFTFYEKQILEGILESVYGHQGFSNLRKAGPLGVFSSLHLAIRDLAIYEKQIV